MAYMDYNEYKQLMEYGDYKESRAVKVYLSRAAHYSRMKKRAETINADHPSDLMAGYIDRFERLRVESVWKAFWIAEAEQEQQWRYIEDVNQFLTDGEQLFGGLEKFSKADQLKIELSELYKELEQEQQKGEWRD
jgi:hypothetical protein